MPLTTLVVAMSVGVAQPTVLPDGPAAGPRQHPGAGSADVDAHPATETAAVAPAPTRAAAAGADAGAPGPSAWPSGSAAASRPLEPYELAPGVYRDRSGLPELVIQNSLFGGLVGLAATSAIFVGSERAASGSLLGLGAGVALPLLLTRGRTITTAQAAFYNFGERWGLVTGALVPMLLDSNSTRLAAGSLAAGFAVGLGATLAAYPWLHLTPGQVSALGTGHTFGTIGAALTLMLFDVVPSSGTGFAGPVLFVSNAALVATFLAREHFDVDRRRLVFADLGGYLGLAVGIGAGFLATGGGDFRGRTQAYAACMLAGTVVGLGSGYALSDELDEFREGAPALGALDPPSPVVMGADGPEARRAIGVTLLRGRF